MANGKFQSSLYSGAGTGYRRYIEVIWSSTNNVSNNTSTITWHAYVRSPDSGTTSYVYAKGVAVTINDSTTTLIGNTAQPTYKDQSIGSGTTTITHGSDGTKTVSVSIKAQFYTYGTDNSTYSGNIKLTTNPVYSLSVSSDSGSSISVIRTSCAGYGTTGAISAGTNKLCKGDIIKISASTSSGYTLRYLVVNGNNYSSGNSLTVGTSISVASASQILSSIVGATSANIGSVSTITVTKSNSSYYHSLQYSFGSLSGYIKADGSLSSTESKFNQTSVAFSIPTSFYAQIPNASYGVCTITCRTYSSSTSSSIIGSATTCTFSAYAPGSSSRPIVTGSVVDIDPVTTILTGDNTKLVRYRSTVECTISATPVNSSTITSLSINGYTPSNNKKVFTGVSSTQYKFEAIDSRNYKTSYTATPTMIAYIGLTCNPVIYRPSPSDGSIVMTVTGNMYRGSFGAYSNTLTIKYRYKESGGTYGSWTTISSGITYGASSYKIDTPFSFGNSFDYLKEYIFQIQATDGANNAVLSTVTKTITVKSGIPIFDWGKNDFNVNVPLMLNNVNILDIIYPIGSVYMCDGANLPSSISNIGTWTSITTGISGVYGWKRTA